jgi:hypothetical protein
MNNLREAAQQALEALEYKGNIWIWHMDCPLEAAIAALKAALAEPEPAAPEHTMSMYATRADYDAAVAAPIKTEADRFCDRYCTWLDHAPGCVRAAPTVVEPVAWVNHDELDGLLDEPRHAVVTGKPDGWRRTPLYRHPPRKPLTDEEIHDCFQNKSRDKTEERRLITRAIEAAHGIGGKHD